MADDQDRRTWRSEQERHRRNAAFNLRNLRQHLDQIDLDGDVSHMSLVENAARALAGLTHSLAQLAVLNEMEFMIETESRPENLIEKEGTGS